MKKIIFYSYLKCSTCRKAAKWLDDKYLEFQLIDIIEETPILSIDENGNPIYGGMPKWGIFQLSSLVKINSKTYLQVLLDNIFDIHYREFASGISSPGRSLNLKLTLN